MNGGGNLVTDDVEKAEVLHAFFASVFTDKISSHTAVLGNTVWGGGEKPSVVKEQVKNYLEKLDMHKSMSPDLMHPKVLRELADVIVEPLAIIFENSWRSGEVPDDWKKANIVLIFKKGEKENPGNYRLVSLISVPGKIMEQVLKKTIWKHLEERKVIRNSQHGLTKGGSCVEDDERNMSEHAGSSGESILNIQDSEDYPPSRSPSFSIVSELSAKDSVSVTSCMSHSHSISPIAKRKKSLHHSETTIDKFVIRTSRLQKEVID
nr:uncharacterized protein LOC125644272 [Caretta caretta]